MSDFVAQKVLTLAEELESLKEVVNETKETVSEVFDKVNRIEVGLFGDEKMNYIGIIQKNKLQDEEINHLKLEIADMKKISKEQTLIIEAKRNFRDEIVFWSKRVFWICLVIMILMLLFTGKIGLLDVLKILS